MTLLEFVIKSKLTGYASGGEGQEKKFEDGSQGFEIISDGYRYLDRYYGFNPFFGSEHIFDSDDTMLWAMNYFGEIIKESSDPQVIYSFLKEAMLQISSEYPFRGPANHERSSLRYTNQQNGSFDHFHGIESIYQNDEKIYVLYYHGGKIQRCT